VRIVEPKVFLVGETTIVHEGLEAFLEHIGVPGWKSDAPSDSEELMEVMGRLCYNSFASGLNPNVTKIREGNLNYLQNIVAVKHGSVTEHAEVNFIFADVSRVFTHELVRHRAGVAISQESMRYVRMTNLGFWVPTVIRETPEAMTIMTNVVEALEDAQNNLAELTKIAEAKSFDEKKKLTSAFRRVAPHGHATRIGWSANMRAIRHCIEMRTDPHAEEEIRLVFGKVGEIMRKRYPNLFADYEVEVVDGYPWYKTANRKV
jgi:thymidylate synthase (FAD)